ncbi:tetraspanin-8-like [Actinidia eriantha]|uniref:tetraspanin-8-like n=1 Tax=Actinidia eriantha TaxID=165200 RepID=UPI00258ABEBB|nr:tetraspanin-8-like [Actinidia eriantha]
MVRLSNGFVACVNVLTLLLSCAALATAAWFFAHQSTTCQKFLVEPLFFLGLSLLIVSLLGLLGSCCRVQPLLWVYLFLMFLFILALIGFTIFSIVVTNKGMGKAISGRGYKEYRLGDYNNWLQNYVVNDGNWDKIKSCLADANVCSSFPQETVADFNKRNLSPTQSGCCKPPTYCGYEYKNATFWTIPKEGPAAPDTDCKTWSNNHGVLCYDCMSCKAGVLANIKKEWRLLAGANTTLLIVVILVYSVGYCALRNNRLSSYRRYKGGYP